MFPRDGAFFTVFDAVHADDASACINRVRVDIDTSGFASLFTGTALGAFGCVDCRFEPGKTGEKAQNRADGTDGVAPCSSAAPGQKAHKAKSKQGDDERRHAFYPDFCRIKCVRIRAFRKIGQNVVAKSIDGGKEVLRDTAISAVRRDEQGNGSDGNGHENDKNA